MSGADNVHATALVLAGRGLLLRGASGSGKSSLALSLLRRAEASCLDAALIADDQVFLEREGNRLLARAPETTAGLIEVRGIGILPERHVGRASLDLVVDLVPREAVERLPDPDAHVLLAGLALRRIALPARDPGFGADVLLTLARAPAFWVRTRHG